MITFLQYPPIKDVPYEKEKTVDFIEDIYERFKCPKNDFNRKETLDKLDGYTHVENEYTLIPGRYARYLDSTDIMNIYVKVGGFVVSDNGYTVVFRNNNNGRNYRVRKRNKSFFMIMMSEDVLRTRIYRMRN